MGIDSTNFIKSVRQLPICRIGIFFCEFGFHFGSLHGFYKRKEASTNMDPVGSSQLGGIAHPSKGHPWQLAFLAG